MTVIPGPRVIEIDDAPLPKAGEMPAPVIVETDDTRPIEQANQVVPPVEATIVSAGRHAPIKVAVAGLAVLAVGVLTIDTLSWVSVQFERGPLLGAAAVACIGAGVAGTVYWILSEIRALAGLRTVEHLRAGLSDGNGRPIQEIERDLAPALNALPKTADVVAAVSRYRQQVQPHHSAAQRIELLSRVALRPSDERAQGAIRRAAAHIVGITALSPTPLSDTLFFAGRAVRLVRQIAEIYGHRPGIAGTTYLVRRILLGAGSVGVADVLGNTAGDMLAQHLGDGLMEKLTGKLSAKAAESLFAAQRMARIGLLAIGACRPVPFGPGETPSVTRLVAGAMGTTVSAP